MKPLGIVHGPVDFLAVGNLYLPKFVHNHRCGIVRLTGRELADRRRSRLSRGELTPFSERGGAVLLEDVAAVAVTVLVEVVVDRGIGGG